MSSNYTVYTVWTGDADGNEWQVGTYTDESAATTIADETGNSRITEMVVPLPEVVVRIEGGFVSSVTTADGLELEATVRDYDTAEADNLGGGGTDEYGYYEEYTL